MIGQSIIGFLQVSVVTTVLACGGAAQDVSHDKLAVAAPMNEVNLKSQTETVLSDFDALSRSLSGDSADESVNQLQTLRGSIDEMGTLAAPATAPQTTPKVTTGQQSAPPTKVVKSSSEPPTDAEIAAMERAVEFTHRPGPPLKETKDPGDDGPMSLRVQQATTSALVYVDQAEAAIREDDLEAARVALARAQELIDELYSSMP